MPVDEFIASHAKKAKDFARQFAGIEDGSALSSKISSEFVWFTLNENNKLTAVNYMYTSAGDDGKNRISRVTLSGLNKIDLRQIAAGNVSLKYQDNALLVTHDNEFSYDGDQTQYNDLATRLFDLFVEEYDVSEYESQPLLRLASADKGNGIFGLNLFDILSTGYARYYVRVSADANSSLSDLVDMLNAPANVETHSAQVKEYGVLVYSDIQN